MVNRIGAALWQAEDALKENMRPQHEFITRPDGKIMISQVAR
jgi:hypothetical protein